MFGGGEGDRRLGICFDMIPMGFGVFCFVCFRWEFGMTVGWGLGVGFGRSGSDDEHKSANRFVFDAARRLIVVAC
jgi:hypothetical protein